LNVEIQSSVSALKQIVSSLNNITNLIENQSSAKTESSSSIEQVGAQIKNITKIVNDKKQLSNNLSETAKDGLEKRE
jgi:methyl-accepting chemotaxis protein